MASPEMEFHLGNTDVKMYVDDNGMYRIYRSFTDRDGEVYVGCTLERDDATHLFGKEVMRLTRQWELEA